MGLIKDWKQYRRSQGKGQIAPKIHKQKKAKKLPKGVKRKRSLWTGSLT